MRPDNNRSLDWEEITLDAATMRGTFKLDQHKNVNKASRRAIAAEMLGYELTGQEGDLMQEIIDGWAVPDVEVFAPDLEPVCADPAPDDDDAPAIAVQPPPRRARK